MYILFVPLGELLIFRKKLRWLLLARGAFKRDGALPSVHEGGRGADAGGRRRLRCFCAPWRFTAHILIIDRVSPRTDGVKLSCVQFAVAAVVSLIVAMIAEKPSLAMKSSGCWVPIAYAGDYERRRRLHPADRRPEGYRPHRGLPDPVLGKRVRRAGRLADFLGDKMTAREYAGCGMMLIGILLAAVAGEEAGGFGIHPTVKRKIDEHQRAQRTR